MKASDSCPHFFPLQALGVYCPYHSMTKTFCKRKYAIKEGKITHHPLLKSHDQWVRVTSSTHVHIPLCIFTLQGSIVLSMVLDLFESCYSSSHNGWYNKLLNMTRCQRFSGFRLLGSFKRQRATVNCANNLPQKSTSQTKMKICVWERLSSPISPLPLHSKL